MPEVIETQLPGVGVRHEFVTGGGERVALLTHRTGRREVALFDRSDPDACSTLLHLDVEDCRLMAELLGGHPVSEAVTGAQRVDGVSIDWIRIGRGAGDAQETIGERRLRARSGASIVALVRSGETLPAPGPDQVLEPGDVAVAVGTPDGLLQLRGLLET